MGSPGDRHEALDALRAELDRIEAMDDADAAKTAAIRAITEPLRLLSERAARIRRAHMVAIRRIHQFSLRVLGDQVGISKPRAQQIMDQVKKEADSGHGTDDSTR